MPRKRSFLGKNPGGRFRGIPGNPMMGSKWGGVFRKRGDWGILNPAEWTSLGTRTPFGEAGPRPQGQLQQVIDYNLGFEEQLRQMVTEPPRPPKPEPIVKIPTQPYQPIPISQPAKGGSGKATGGGGTGSGASSAAPAGGKTGGGAVAAKPAKISTTVKAIKAPVKRGR